jgi:hypothetical protein
MMEFKDNPEFLDDDQIPGEELSYCPTCKIHIRKSEWQPEIVTCEFGTEHFGERCPRCKKVRVILEPHEQRPDPDARDDGK